MEHPFLGELFRDVMELLSPLLWGEEIVWSYFYFDTYITVLLLPFVTFSGAP